jgi:hypothetical protein
LKEQLFPSLLEKIKLYLDESQEDEEEPVESTQES